MVGSLQSGKLEWDIRVYSFLGMEALLKKEDRYLLIRTPQHFPTYATAQVVTPISSKMVADSGQSTIGFTKVRRRFSKIV